MKTGPVLATTTHDDTAVVTLTGELDLHVVREINDALTGALATHRHVACDTTSVTFADSSILGTFVMVARAAEQAGGTFRLVGAQPNLRRLLRLTGLDQILVLHEDVPA